MSQRFRFWKMSGAGNDFVVADARAAAGLEGRALALALCPRRTSVGADGILLVRAREGLSVKVEYRNSDGSEAEFCGNGARCVARFIWETEIVEAARFTLHFKGASAEAVVDEAGARVLLPAPDPARRLERPALEEIELWSVRAGVPHVLALTGDDPDRALDALEARLLESAPELPGEANVSALRFASTHRLDIATLERGSQRTLACGSAAVAAASLAYQRTGSPRWTVVPPSGIPLGVSLSEEGALLEGEARLVYEGVLPA